MTAKRNRIVIDLNKAPVGQAVPVRAERARRRIGRVLGFIGIILVLAVIGIVAGGFFWWQHYKYKPGYSLALLVDAAQRNDRTAIDQLIDTDKVTANFVAQARQRTAGSTLLSALMPSQIEQLAARFTPRVKQTVHDQLPTEIQRLSAPAAG